MLPLSLRSLPYLVHTNRELGLMLRGVKPLAVFSWIDGYEVECVRRYLRLFDRHVAAGTLRKSQQVRSITQLPVVLHHHVCYMLPGEEWRAEAVRKLYELPKPWKVTYERRLGELLGYEDWQNDFWLKGFGEPE